MKCITNCQYTNTDESYIFCPCYRHCIGPVNPLPNDVLDPSKFKKVADDNFKFDKYGRKFSKRVENTVGKGEIARYEQFLLFLQCFQKTCTADT